jgi:hypothetical protein
MYMLSAFFQHTYDKYTPRERALGRWLLIVDGIGVPIFTAAYVSIAIGLAADTDASDSVAPLWVDALSWFSAALASFVLYQHLWVAPLPIEDDVEMFGVMQKIGRWIYLTRQTLCLQAIHGVISLRHRAVSPALFRGTHATAVAIGGMGIFVTSQYFILVANHPDYLLRSKTWHDKGLPFKALMHFIHIPCGFLALLDLAVIKNRQLLLSQTPPFTTITLIYLAYVIFYLLLVHVNHVCTNQWPYGFMKELNTPLLWCRFVVVQYCILVVFLSIALLTAFYSPVFWR